MCLSSASVGFGLWFRGWLCVGLCKIWDRHRKFVGFCWSMVNGMCGFVLCCRFFGECVDVFIVLLFLDEVGVVFLFYFYSFIM